MWAKTQVLFASLAGPSVGLGQAVAMAAALSGQRRVLGDSEALARDLATIAEDILYARLRRPG